MKLVHLRAPSQYSFPRRNSSIVVYPVHLLQTVQWRLVIRKERKRDYVRGAGWDRMRIGLPGLVLSAKHCATYMSVKLFPNASPPTDRWGKGYKRRVCFIEKDELTEQDPQLQLVQSLALVHLQEEQSLEVSRVSLVVLLLRHVK